MPFGVDRRLRRVQVFGVPVAENPPSEAEDLPGGVKDGNDQPITEEGRKGTPLEKVVPASLGDGLWNSLPLQELHERLRGFWGVAEGEGLLGSTVDSPLLEVLPCRFPSRGV